MKGKNIRVSLFNQLVHEMFVSCRGLYWAGKSHDEIQDSLGKQVTRNIKLGSTYGLVFVVSAVLIANAGSTEVFSIRLGTVELNLPKIYLSCVASYCFAAVIFQLLMLAVFITTRESLPYTFIGRSRFSGARRALLGNENFDVLWPIRSGHFFQRVGLSNKLLITTLILIFGAALLPSIAAYLLIWKTNLLAIRDASEVYLSTSTGIVSLALLTLPLLFAILSFIPSKGRKDKQTVRWIFLVHATKNGRRAHPQAQRWLSKEFDPKK